MFVQLNSCPFVLECANGILCHETFHKTHKRDEIENHTHMATHQFPPSVKHRATKSLVFGEYGKEKLNSAAVNSLEQC